MRYPRTLVVDIETRGGYGDCFGTGYNCEDLAAILNVNIQTINAFKRKGKMHKGFAAAIKLLREKDALFVKYSECVEKSRLMKVDMEVEKALVPKTSVTDLQRKILEKVDGKS